MKGLVSNCQRYSMFDGYGLRSVVFLMGCTLRCRWCQNPENLVGQIRLMFAPEACSGCGACVQACRRQANTLSGGILRYDRALCAGCMACVEECFYNARKPSGQEREAGELAEEILRDQPFFASSGGGVTLSGGEPLMQSEFCAGLLRRCREAGVHTAIETAGNVPWEAFARVLPYTMLFLYDVKLASSQAHRRWTGCGNERILQNLARVCGSGREVIARVPLIPGVNGGEEFAAIVELVRGYPEIRELHILPYHDLGESKYAQLGMGYPMPEGAENTAEEILRCENIAKNAGLRVSVGGAGFCRKRQQETIC